MFVQKKNRRLAFLIATLQLMRCRRLHLYGMARLEEDSGLRHVATRVVLRIYVLYVLCTPTTTALYAVRSHCSS
jgi:hypothetical protein